LPEALRVFGPVSDTPGPPDGPGPVSTVPNLINATGTASSPVLDPGGSLNVLSILDQLGI
jgi:hypothetical protein